MARVEKQSASSTGIPGGKPTIVAGIPAYNEEKTIAKVVLQAQEYVDLVVICDDGSTDMTAKIAERLGAEVLSHEKNLGYGAAIQSLFRRARELNANVLVTLDGDGQHDPSEIPVLLKPVLKDDVDIAIGSRFLERKQKSEVPAVRRWGIRAITKLTGIAMNGAITDAQHGFRAYGSKALEGLSLLENGMGVSVEVLLKANRMGLRVAEVPVNCNYLGLEKTSRHDLLSHGAGVISCILRLVMEKRPLLFLGVPGVVSLAVGVLFGVWMLQIYALEHQIVTNIALASIAFVMIGLFSIFNAITIYAIVRQTRKHNNK